MLKWLTGRRDDAKPQASKSKPQAGGAAGQAKAFDKAEAGPPKLPLDIARIAEQDLAVVFKHSTSCPVSFAADREMRAFMASHPQVPVHKVLVREQRELSQQIAQWAGIRHESPQVLVLRKGAVVASASHGDVTEDYLAEAVAEPA